MRKILYILLLLPVIGNAQIKLFGNAVERMTTDAWNYRVDSTGDTTYRFRPRYGQLYITNNRMPSNITVSGADVRFGTFSNDANSHYHISCGSSATNSFAYYTGGGTLASPSATLGSTQFNISVWRGYDGSSWSNGGFTNVAAEATWTNTTGGHPIYEEFRATSRNTNTAQVRRYWSALRNTYYFNPGTDGKFANGISQSIEPIGKAYFTGTVNDTVHIIQANSGQNVDIHQIYLSTTPVWRLDKNGYTYNTKLFVNSPTAATDVDSIVVRQNGEYVPALASTVMGGKVDSITKSNDTFYYWKLGTKYFAGKDNSGSAGSVNWGDIIGSLSAQTDLQAALDAKVDENAAITGATKTKITYDAKGLVTAGADATTADIAPSTNRNYVTDAQQTVISNTSGTNTGDQTITLTGDVTGSGTGSFAATIATGSVTLAKMANMATASILGRNTAGTGAPEVLSASTVKSILSLGNVENTALSTWAGSANITTVGTISSGTWNGGVIPGQYGGTGVANTGKTITVSGNTTIGSSTNTVTLATTGNTNVTLPTSGTLATLAGSETLTNKTITSPIISSISNTGTLTLPTVTSTITSYKESNDASTSTPTPVGDARQNKYYLTALATAPTFAAPSGTPANGNELLIRIKDNGTARALAWNAIYRGGTSIALPTTTTISKTMYVQFVYNSADSKWDLVGLTDGL